MAISILNNIASLTAQNQLNITQTNLQKTLFQLSSGSRINSGADDAAGLAIANGLQANVTALTQSAQNANATPHCPYGRTILHTALRIPHSNRPK